MKCKFIIFSFFLLLGSFQVYGQPMGDTKDALVNSGDEQIERGQYYRALEQYEKA